MYLSGVRFAQIAQGLRDLALSSLPRLEYVLRDIRRSTPSCSRPQRLPITPGILRLLFLAWSQRPITFDAMRLWAACCVVFFGFLRVGEFSCPLRGLLRTPCCRLVMSLLIPTIPPLLSHSFFARVRLMCLGLEFGLIWVEWMALFAR